MEDLPSGKWSPVVEFRVGPEDELGVLSGGMKDLIKRRNEWIKGLFRKSESE